MRLHFCIRRGECAVARSRAPVLCQALCRIRGVGAVDRHAVVDLL
jgi:hypothetical protein